MIKIIINGAEKEFPNEISLADLLQYLSLASERIAVELNQTVIRRADWHKTKIKNRDALEIVHFVGGG